MTARTWGRPPLAAVWLSGLWSLQPSTVPPAQGLPGSRGPTLLRGSSSGAGPWCGFLVRLLRWLQRESVPEESPMRSPAAPARRAGPPGLLCLPVAATSWSPLEERDERASAQTGCSRRRGQGGRGAAGVLLPGGRGKGGPPCQCRSHWDCKAFQVTGLGRGAGTTVPSKSSPEHVCLLT